MLALACKGDPALHPSQQLPPVIAHQSAPKRFAAFKKRNDNGQGPLVLPPTPHQHGSMRKPGCGLPSAPGASAKTGWDKEFIQYIWTRLQADIQRMGPPVPFSLPEWKLSSKRTRLQSCWLLDEAWLLPKKHQPSTGYPDCCRLGRPDMEESAGDGRVQGGADRF